MITVTLDKGPRGSRTWSDETEQRARIRADALCDLHGPGATITTRRNPAGQVISYYVDAAFWYRED